MKDITKAVVATVDLGFAQIEGLMLPDGSYAVGASQLAEVFQFDKSQASRTIKTLLGKDLNYQQVTVQWNNSPVNAISVEQAKSLITALASKSNPVAYRMIHNKSIQAICQGKEQSIQKALHQKLGGQTEVVCLVGKIDLLTSSEIIEIKNIKSWKAALGQILVYGSYYPSHGKRIHLFGKTQESYLNLVRKHCANFGVRVTWQSK